MENNERLQKFSKCDIRDLITLIRSQHNNDQVCDDIVEVIEERISEAFDRGCQAESYCEAMSYIFNTEE